MIDTFSDLWRRIQPALHEQSMSEVISSCLCAHRLCDLTTAGVFRIGSERRRICREHNRFVTCAGCNKCTRYKYLHNVCGSETCTRVSSYATFNLLQWTAGTSILTSLSWMSILKHDCIMCVRRTSVKLWFINNDPARDTSTNNSLLKTNQAEQMLRNCKGNTLLHVFSKELSPLMSCKCQCFEFITD